MTVGPGRRLLPVGALAAVASLAWSPAARADWPEYVDAIEETGMRSFGTTFSAAIDDFNDDGLPDILVTKTPGLLTYELVRGGENRMFYQDPDRPMTFAEVGEEVGVAGSCENRCLYLMDYDGDGDQDIYNSVAQHNELYRADGDGTFTEVARDAGVDSDRTSHEGFWFDYDMDGQLDLFFTNGPKLGSLENILYHNEGDGTFRDVTTEAGVEGSFSGKGACFLDFDHDGWLDIFTSNGLDCQNYYLFRNNHDGTFTDEALDLGLETGDNDEFLAWALCYDYNNDGETDILIGSHGVRWPRNTVFRGNADGTFDEVAEEIGVIAPYDGSAMMIADLDNDGWLDMVFGQRDYPYIPYRNLEGQGFVAIEGGSGLDNAHEAPNWTMAPGDIDGDGDLDLYLGNGRANKPASDHLFINQGTGNNHLMVEVEGTMSHRSGAGARIVVEAGDLIQTRWVGNRRVTCSCPSSRAMHFGLGQHDVADVVTVYFPGGGVAQAFDVEANTTVRLVEPEPEGMHDEDRDGIPDLVDRCPWTPGLSVTDVDGCAAFEGGDGTERVELVAPVDYSVITGATWFEWSGTVDGYVLQFDDEPTFDYDRLEIGPLEGFSAELTDDLVDELYHRFGGGRVLWRVVGSTDAVVEKTRVREIHLPVDGDYIGIVADDLNTWDPAHVRVTAGTTVTWHIPTEEEGNINRFTHDVMITDLEGNVVGRSEYLEPFDGRNEFQFTFDEPGLYHFMCVFHGWSCGTSQEFQRIGEGPVAPGPYRCHSGSVTVVEDAS